MFVDCSQKISNQYMQYIFTIMATDLKKRLKVRKRQITLVKKITV